MKRFSTATAVGRAGMFTLIMLLLFYPDPDFGGDSKNKYNRAYAYILWYYYYYVYINRGVMVKTNNGV